MQNAKLEERTTPPLETAPLLRKAGNPMQMMRKLYNQMVTEKAGLKAEPMIQIGGLKKKDKEMAMAE